MAGHHGPALSADGPIFITPSWVAILDFEQRFPSALERAMARAAPD